jgi:hypothetical protein
MLCGKSNMAVRSLMRVVFHEVGHHNPGCGNSIALLFHVLSFGFRLPPAAKAAKRVFRTLEIGTSLSEAIVTEGHPDNVPEHASQAMLVGKTTRPRALNERCPAVAHQARPREGNMRR